MYHDEKIIKLNDDDLPLNIKFQRKVVAAMYKKAEYEEEIDDLVETNLWEITASQRNTVNNIFYKTGVSGLGHVRVYSLQYLKQNQWLNTEVMDVIFDYVAATRSDTVSFAHIVIRQESSKSLLESQIRKMSFDTNIIPVIHCNHWFPMIVYLKKLSFALILFIKQKKYVKEYFFIINGSSGNQWQRVDIIVTKHFTNSD